MVSESSNIDHVTLSPRLQTRLSHSPSARCRTPRARASPLRLARTLSLPAPSQPSRLARRTPKPTAQAQASLRRIGRHQKRKTPLLYVARIAHRPSSIAPRGLDLVSV